ncbi:bacillithiol biosynthesis deacetylase BshB1 [candidate division KSB1 bacterium]
MRLDYIVFAAHPDDAELLCGGTIYKLSNKGFKVGIIDLTQGEMSSRGSPEQRKEESANASEILGVKIRENLKIQDTQIINNRENQLKIISILRKYTPETVILPNSNARHPDHKDAYYLVSDSIFYSGLLKIETETGLKPFRPKIKILYINNREVNPTFIIDISEEFPVKIEALRAYKSQFYNPDIKEFETYISSEEYFKFIKIRAKYYGFLIGKKYGEPFIIEEPFELKDFKLI